MSGSGMKKMKEFRVCMHVKMWILCGVNKENILFTQRLPVCVKCKLIK